MLQKRIAYHLQKLQEKESKEGKREESTSESKRPSETGEKERKREKTK
jgi:hypothetical protein